VGRTTIHYKVHDWIQGDSPYTSFYASTSDKDRTAECSFDIFVRDNEPPQIHDCPEDIVVVTDTDKRYSTQTITNPTASDNYAFNWQPVRRDRNETWDVTTKIARNAQLPATTTSKFDLGKTTVYYEVHADHTIFSTGEVDDNGDKKADINRYSHLDKDEFYHRAYCRFTVTVLDNQAPAIIDCPSDIYVNTDDPPRDAITGTKFRWATVTWQHPYATDNVGFRWRPIRRSHNQTNDERLLLDKCEDIGSKAASDSAECKKISNVLLLS
jgi:hypothetical protein